MKIKIITTAFVTLLLISSQTFASPDEDVFEDIKMRVYANENMSDSVILIALPNIEGDHNVNRPDAAENGGDQGGGDQGGGDQEWISGSKSRASLPRRLSWLCAH